MSAVTDDLAALAVQLSDAGIPATTNAAHLWPLITSHPVAALVDRPEGLQLRGMGGSHMAFTAIVRLVARGPDNEAEPRLQEALIVALKALGADMPTQPDRLTSGDVQVPAYRIAVQRAVSI